MAFFKWLTALILCLFLSALHAWPIGAKGHVIGPAIHSTYFITPNNAAFSVHAKLYAGNLLNGLCRYNATYDLGEEIVRSGDVVAFDAFALKALVGEGANCMSVSYTQKQQVMDSMLMVTDGINYVNTIPAMSQVTIY